MRLPLRLPRRSGDHAATSTTSARLRANAAAAGRVCQTCAADDGQRAGDHQPHLHLCRVVGCRGPGWGRRVVHLRPDLWCRERSPETIVRRLRARAEMCGYHPALRDAAFTETHHNTTQCGAASTTTPAPQRQVVLLRPQATLNCRCRSSSPVTIAGTPSTWSTAVVVSDSRTMFIDQTGDLSKHLKFG